MTTLNWRLRTISILTMLLASAFCRAQWAPLSADDGAAQRVNWWREARIGMFLHWGVYSILGRGEWVQWNEQIPVGE
jgi:alpha-L-fucosidase